MAKKELKRVQYEIRRITSKNIELDGAELQEIMKNEVGEVTQLIDYDVEKIFYTQESDNTPQCLIIYTIQYI